MKKQLVKFVINKELDVQNHLVDVRVYKEKSHSDIQKSKRLDQWTKLSVPEQRKVIYKYIAGYYSARNKKFLEAISADLNKEWIKTEKIVVKRFEKIHKKPFRFGQIKGILSSAGRFSYNTNQKWFATSMMKNKFLSIDTALHELMHFMFHKYYWEVCIKKGLSLQQIKDIKEAFTVILNLEFSDMLFQPDYGYPEHQKIRSAIEKSWIKHRDFDKALEAAIKIVR